MPGGYDALSEREKQTLRLMLEGHDAKSIARTLDLSVHTIHERLREARRKLGVSSSREAARLLHARERTAPPENPGDKEMGEAGDRDRAHQPAETPAGRRRGLKIGATAMSLSLVAALALTLAAPGAPSRMEQDRAATDPVAADAEAAARRWLALVDAGDWQASWAQTAGSFRALNTAKVWAQVSEKVRRPLGAMRSRALLAQEDVPAPPRGYRLVKFRTSFANRADAVETLTLVEEDGGWRVTGIYVS